MSTRQDLLGAALVLSLAGANLAYAQVPCEKNCGYGNATGSGTREGDCGFQLCFWVECEYAPYGCVDQYGSYGWVNDNCGNPQPCFPL